MVTHPPNSLMDMTMNTDNANKWLTLLANVGVVIGLALLIFEIRQNSELVRAQIHQARSDAWAYMRQDLADSEFLLPAYEKFRAAGGYEATSVLDVLDPVDSARVFRYLQSRVGDYDNLFYQYRQGYLDEEYYRTRIEPSIKRLAPTWFEYGMLDTMSSSFRAEVERLVSEDD